MGLHRLTAHDEPATANPRCHARRSELPDMRAVGLRIADWKLAVFEPGLPEHVCCGGTGFCESDLGDSRARRFRSAAVSAGPLSRY
jgi:hypothetical protein